ncbi:DUF4023 family protein, partial [Bacillus thuringiensis]|nr:DUF4023 family protein [Bacillus thuringiensis]
MSNSNEFLDTLHEKQAKDAHMNPHKMKHLYALPNQHDDFLA